MRASKDEPSAAGREKPQRPEPQVAVITVTYNRVHTLRRAIDSAISQEYPSLRIIVVDDGSTDETPALLRRYQADPRVKVVRHDTNRGMLAARNTALDQLTGEDIYFCYLDSDDTLVPGAISTMVNAFREHGDTYSIVFAASQEMHTGVADGWHSLDSPTITYDDQLAERVGGNYMELIRRDLADGLRLQPKARVGDHVMLTQVIKKKPALIIPDVVQLTDRSGADRMTTYVGQDRAYAESVMWTRLYELAGYGTDLRQAYPKRYALLLDGLARAAALSGDARRARLASREAMRFDSSLRTFVSFCAALAPAWVLRGCVRTLHRIRARRVARTKPLETGSR